MKRLLLGTLAAAVLLPLLAALALAAWLFAIEGDLTAHRDVIARQLSRVLARDVTLDGELRLTLAAHPTLTVTDLAIGNAPWGQTPRLLSVKRVELRGELLPLLRGDLALTGLLVQGAELALEIDAQGRRNWVFDDDTATPGAVGVPGLSRSSALDLRVEDSTVAYRDAEGGRDWALSVDRGAVRSIDWEAPLVVSLASTWANAPLLATGSAGPLSVLARGTAPYPLDLSGELLGIRYSAAGQITPARLADARLTVQAQAESLDAVRAVFGEVVPAGAPLRLTMTVTGSQDLASARLEASLGASQATAKLDLDVQKGRPRLAGQVELERLDLLPWLGSPRKTGEPDAKSGQTGQRAIALPHDVDADIEVRARQVALPEITLDTLSGRLVRRNDEVVVEDLKLAAKPFDVAGRIAVDTAASPPAIALALTAPRVDAAWLLGSDLQGTLSAQADLKALGADPAAWVQSAQGTLDARLRGTTEADAISIGLRRAGTASAPAELDAEGQWGGNPVQLSGKVGTPSHWLSPDQPTPVELTGRLGGISASASGTVADLAHARGISLAVQAQAPTLEAVGAVWGVRHHAEGPVRVKTRLAGGPDNWEFSGLTAEVGPAGATGRLSLRVGTPRPRVEGRLTLSDVQLRSLLPPETLAADGESAGTGQHLFRSVPLAFQDLAALDADIALDGVRLDLVYHLLPEFAGTLQLSGGHLKLHVGGTKGRASRRSIDFETGGSASMPTVRLRVQDPEAEAAHLLDGTAAAGLLSGRVAVDLDLRGQGKSLAAIIATLDGQAHFLMGQGTVNATSLDRLVVGVRTLFGSLLGTGRTTQGLNCAFVDLDAKKGVLQGAALLDTETSTFTLDGKIDLARETVDISGTPLEKGFVRFSTAVPVRLTGSLANPRAEIQKTSTLLRLGLLIAKLNPATALPALGLAALEEVARGNPCVEKIREAAGKGR